ncbi:hypothetical protein NIE88_05050 [Sporolactobacillus shoreicorticis]|uniref:Phage protein n=1 Tax=Sporolactobacillus shoreicorticis TaxID=1923877 RepID=A0ABW5RYE5_9BACL|nr:hypothetical protein [Sporolactobacillus shoreicorticis]MCO7125141.1 hypothetical protein [Sporolactobacillus shoreicorticis]
MDYKELNQLQLETDAVKLKKDQEVAKTVICLCQELRINGIEKITPRMVAAIAELSKQI